MGILAEARAHHHVVLPDLFDQIRNVLTRIRPIGIGDHDDAVLSMPNASFQRCTVAAILAMPQ